jgi:hypothetical protein
MNLQHITDAYIKNYRHRLSRAWEINTGNCFRYAMIVHQLYGGILWTVDVHDREDNYYGSHAFIKIDNRFYDAETAIDGVVDWELFPYFERLKSSEVINVEYIIRKHSSIRDFKKHWQPTKKESKADQKLLKKLQRTKNDS